VWRRGNISNHTDNARRGKGLVWQWIGITPGHKPGIGSCDNAMDADLIVEAKDRHVSDQRVTPALDHNRLSRCNRRQHARAIKRSEEFPPLASPMFSYAI
jgi:hypothetical protein